MLCMLKSVCSRIQMGRGELPSQVGIRGSGLGFAFRVCRFCSKICFMLEVGVSLSQCCALGKALLLLLNSAPPSTKMIVFT